MKRDYFEDIYAEGPDPWGFETSAYERRKYDLTLAALPRRRYRRAVEPGCSIGVLTADLARRCDAVEAWEPIAAPRAAADARTPDHVTVRDAILGDAEPLPGPPVDLIVVSEVLYYLPADEITDAVGRLLDHAEPGADLVAVHWRHHIDGMDLDGDGVHATLAAMDRLEISGTWIEADFRIDVLRVR
ncbi:SAM-dependent methyltransferase [uncultured Corynebacterium sp.]|uniref:SAM-dependent methyltransferase n=1 Tax=uncultured Corynebacterium sp. TaxID=159447 RepID=UPI0025FE4620|nr:SAM-dependent methyltransferase [uncultured Corynebacterium sp.]